MATRSKFFSWSKGRQSSTEPYHRTGGLLPIDTSVGDEGKEVVLVGDLESTFGPGRRRPPNLTIVPPDYKSDSRSFLSPASAQQYAALSKSASNLLAVVDDMLRSPAAGATLCSRTPASLHKPLPSRPRSMSLPSTPEPVELPGSILLENQGFPSPSPVAGSIGNTMRSVRSGNALSSSTTAKPIPSKVPQHKKSLSDASLQRRSKSRPNLVTSPSTDSKLTTCSVSTTNGDQANSADSSRAHVGADRPLQPSPLIVEGKPWRRTGGGSTAHRDDLGTPSTPTPTTARSRQVDELKATITAQDQTISTLQAQFAGLRVSHEAHIASLVDAHTAEVASLRSYTKALEDQQSQRTLHHASSNNLLFLLDTTEHPQSPSRETPQTTAGGTSASSIRSFKSAFEQQTRASPVRSRDSPEMESLKRKLSAARRPEVGNGDAIRELNMYKQNNVALQKQVELLMTKLNQSKETERNQRRTLENIEKTFDEVQKKASKVEQLEKSTLALQNTIDHLEHRLEIANCVKVDAEEQLWNLRRQRTIFDVIESTGPRDSSRPADHRQSTRTSMSTVFANESPINENESEEPKTLSAFIAHIERLQEQIRQKDTRAASIDVELDRLRRRNDQLESERQGLNLQLDIHGQLLAKTKKNDIHIDELRNTIIQREAMIEEKNKALSMVERQLEHHKRLLDAEVKRHAIFTLHAEVKDDPLPDLTTLASKDDIDRWIDRLKRRLKKENSQKAGLHPTDDHETVVQDLRKEIDFYVREIIYFKLDCRGYKSDIKKLKKVVAQMGNHGNRPSDVDSPDPSVCRSIDTPIRPKFMSGTSGLGISATPSPVLTGPISATVSVDRPFSPPMTSELEAVKSSTAKPSKKRVPKQLDLKIPERPQTPTRKQGTNTANEADNVDPGISPRSVSRLSPERRKPTPPSPDQERFGDLATNFPLSTPAAPTRHEPHQVVSDTSAPQYSQPRTPERSLSIDDNVRRVEKSRSRSNSNPDPAKGKMTPERPPRPRLGLFESPIGSSKAASPGPRTPPRKDVMAEAMRNSPDRTQPTQQARERKLSNSSASNHPASPSTRDAVRSSGSTTGTQPLPFRSREGSAVSSTINLHPNAAPSSPSRRPSTSSSANVPFVIAMGSPHNPALVAPTASVPPTSCSITRNTAVKVTSPTSRTGVGGTMASTTPLTSPVSPPRGPDSTPWANAKPATSPLPSRNTNVSSKAKSETQFPDTKLFSTSAGYEAPTASSRSRITSPTHSRNVSGSSLRQAINLPGRMDFMKGKGKSRKDSISHPTPLASPFDIDRSTSNSENKGDCIGEAI
ncbi:hypothetical protein K458DRAFT_422507 [Lentithecium fluviatile CBS 122367]|uniref:Uncharacterized protein n=1 Tax=Lentithecium fluviatile CBS 122367 TaxID=1168545 RepID=A0A6G1IMH6_9PLEO|nr:hypothetical protein K458DRAFT_422507 [Lentithecium fluviatile CBS 122367]